METQFALDKVVCMQVICETKTPIASFGQMPGWRAQFVHAFTPACARLLSCLSNFLDAISFNEFEKDAESFLVVRLHHQLPVAFVSHAHLVSVD